MTGHDPDGSGDDPHDAGTDREPSGDEPTGDPTAPAEDGTDVGDDTPSEWPADWTAADDATHLADDSSMTDHDAVSDGGGEDPNRAPDDDTEPERTPERTPGESVASDDDETQQDRDEPSSPNDSTTDPTPSSTTDPRADSTTDPGPDPTPGRGEQGLAPDDAGRGRSAGRAEKPPAPHADETGPTISDDGPVTWFLQTNHGGVVIVRDIVSSIAAVAVIGLLLFAISGVWPPLVAVESGSMEPHMSKGDLVFIVDETRYAPESSVGGTGVSTYESAQAAADYEKFGSNGDVIVFRPDGRDRSTPIIHRARFYVEEDENWLDRADPEYLGGVKQCDQVPNDMCPAPYDGFITKGDANPRYDQIGEQSTIVHSDWVRGKAQVRIPLLGWIRLQFANLTAVSGVLPSGLGAFAVRLTALGTVGVAYGVSTRT